jgi:hypothetical protein
MAGVQCTTSAFGDELHQMLKVFQRLPKRKTSSIQYSSSPKAEIVCTTFEILCSQQYLLWFLTALICLYYGKL